MKMKTLYNPTDLNIKDFRIAEAKFDPEGIIIQDNQGNYEETGRTLEWSINAGEKLEFPEYVADRLLKIFEFLQEVKPEQVEEEVKPKEEIVPEAKSKEGKTLCKICGKSFKGIRGLALHMAANHPEEIL